MDERRKPNEPLEEELEEDAAGDVFQEGPFTTLLDDQANGVGATDLTFQPPEEQQASSLEIPSFDFEPVPIYVPTASNSEQIQLASTSEPSQTFDEFFSQASSFEQSAPTFEQPASAFEQPASAFEQPASAFEQPASAFEHQHPSYLHHASSFEQQVPSLEQQVPSLEQQVPNFEQASSLELQVPNFEEQTSSVDASHLHEVEDFGSFFENAAALQQQQSSFSNNLGSASGSFLYTHEHQ